MLPIPTYSVARRIHYLTIIVQYAYHGNPSDPKFSCTASDCRSRKLEPKGYIQENIWPWQAPRINILGASCLGPIIWGHLGTWYLSKDCWQWWIYAINILEPGQPSNQTTYPSRLHTTVDDSYPTNWFLKHQEWYSIYYHFSWHWFKIIR